MKEEMEALERNKKWDIVSFPAGKKTESCRWVYTRNTNLMALLKGMKPNWLGEDIANVWHQLCGNLYTNGKI